MRFVRSAWLASLFGLILAGQVAGQSSSEPPVAPPAPPPPNVRLGADAPKPAPTPGRSEITVNTATIRQHKSGVWSTLSVSASNSLPEDQEALVAVYFPEDSSRQFARRVWLPAQSKRYTHLPVQIPPNIPNGTNRQTLVSIVLDPRAAGRETFQRREGESLTSETLLGISHEAVKSATFARRPTIRGDMVGAEVDGDAWDTLMAARKSVELPESANDIPGDFLPPWSQAMEPFDQFLLSTDRIVDDAAGCAALRGWVRNGGRLWITLDRVAPETVRTLLGGAVNFTVVDRVELDRYELVSSDSVDSEPTREPCDYEQPVEFVRVATDSRDVPCRVNGWPAAIWIPFGQGEVLVTMLAPRGWRPTAERTHSQALRRLAGRLFSVRPGKVDVQQFQSAINQRIGYTIPPRSFGGAILGAYFLALLSGGVYFYRRRQAERLTWVVPIATVVAAAILAGAGARNSTGVPPSVAYSQLVDLSTDTDEAFVHGLAGIYDQQNRPVQWTGGVRGWAIPDMTAAPETRRLVWTNDDVQETQNVTTRAGSVGIAYLEEVRPTSVPFALRASFGPEGLVGRFSGDGAELIDPVIVGPSVPPLAVKLGSDGSFTSAPSDVLATNQFSAESFLTDEQRRRQDVLRGLFRTDDTMLFPPAPTFVAWRREFDTGLKFPADFRTEGEALVLAPLDLRRTPPGTSFRIPASFLRPTSLTGGKGQSLAFNSRSGVWLKNLTAPSETALAFRLPAEVLPCELTQGVLSVRLNAPSREFTVSSFSGTEKRVVKTIPDANGTFEFPLSPEHLSVDEHGRVRLALAVGPTEAQRNPTLQARGATATNSTWQIEYARLTVDGRALSEDAKP